MAYKLFDEDTGEILDVKKKKIKRSEPFFIMEQRTAAEVAKEKDLHGTEYKVLMILFSEMDYENCASITQKYIAERLEMPQPQVSKALKKLIECRVISKETPKGIVKYRVNVAERGSKVK